MVSTTRGTRLSKTALVAGFLALLAGTLAAFRSPATGYELSIYAATPTAFWVGLAVAIGVSLAVSFGARPGSLVRDAAMLLGAIAVAAVVALPLIRGYHHFGGGDSLTHLGWVRDIVAGRLDPVEMLYPGVHTTTIFASNVVGVDYSVAQLFVTLAYVLVFVAFVTLCVRALGSGRWAVPAGLFSALLLLPNNNVSVHLMAHPITQSLLLFPLVLYLLFRYVEGAGESTNRLSRLTPVGVLLTLSLVALVLVHPQGALNVVAVFLTVAGVQFLARRFGVFESIASHRPVYAPTAAAVVAFVAWAPRHERVRGTLESVTNSLVAGSVPADEIAQRSTSLTEIGGSIGGLFAKLFLVSAVFCLLAGVLIVLWYTGRLDDRYAERNALITYLVVALVPLSVAFGVFFASSMTTQHFRYVGFVMVPITLLGALAVSGAARALARRSSVGTTGVGLAVCFLLLLALPLATVHASPFIYQPTQGVSAHQMEGAETTFESMDDDVAFAGIRSSPVRLLHGTYGTERAREINIMGVGPRGVIPGEQFESNLTSYYDGRRYVPVSRSDVRRETDLYDGLRYSQRGFDRLDSSPAIDRVQSNGDYRLYLLGNESVA